MAQLIDIGRQIQYPLREGSAYTTVGRHPKADIFLPAEQYSLLVSRFHATFIASGGELYVIDHSFNGTFYPVDPAGEVNPETRVGSALDTSAFAQYKNFQRNKWMTSHKLAEREQQGALVPRLPGYVEHGFEDPDDIEYLLRMIENPEQRELLLPAGRKMETETILAVALRHLFLVVF